METEEGLAAGAASMERSSHHAFVEGSPTPRWATPETPIPGTC